jgi:hypothetical protein
MALEQPAPGRPSMHVRERAAALGKTRMATFLLL